VVSLANTREVLYVVNRPGNAPSHQHAAEWIDKAINLVAPYAPQVCLRGDTDFSLTAHFDQWAQRVDFIFGMDNTAALRSRAGTLDESCWKPLRRKPRYQTRTGRRRARRDNHKQRIVTERGYLDLRLNHEHVAEFTYRPGKCRRGYRVVVVRKNISLWGAKSRRSVVVSRRRGVHTTALGQDRCSCRCACFTSRSAAPPNG
jgi:Transposase DDE domain group 1